MPALRHDLRAVNIYLAGTYGLGAEPWLGGILFSPEGSVGGGISAI